MTQEKESPPAREGVFSHFSEITDTLTWIWHEVPHEWIWSFIFCSIGVVYIALQIWSVLHG